MGVGPQKWETWFKLGGGVGVVLSGVGVIWVDWALLECSFVCSCQRLSLLHRHAWKDFEETVRSVSCLHFLLITKSLKLYNKSLFNWSLVFVLKWKQINDSPEFNVVCAESSFLFLRWNTVLHAAGKVESLANFQPSEGFYSPTFSWQTSENIRLLLSAAEP